MLDLCSLQVVFDLSKRFKLFGLSKCKVILHFIPPAEKHEFLIFALLINAPRTAVRKWRGVGT
jgi:hypothetical protein